MRHGRSVCCSGRGLVIVLFHNCNWAANRGSKMFGVGEEEGNEGVCRTHARLVSLTKAATM